MASFLDKMRSLTPAERRIICNKDTESPHSGVYNRTQQAGTYLCRRCGLALFRAIQQFESGCGWPSFAGAIEGTVKYLPDADGIRKEIMCQRCDAHLGHVFYGEGYTAENIRYCVNSTSLDFVDDKQIKDSEEAIVAGGCFWGVEYYFERLPDVVKAESGYIGGHLNNPDYHQVCQGGSGHYEAVRVLFDHDKTSYEAIIKHFFNIHDPTQKTGQGPDIGKQYQSAIFYYNQTQHDKAQALIQELKKKGYDVATKLYSAQPFWAAEEYHQHFYSKHHKKPYCHKLVSRFD